MARLLPPERDIGMMQAPVRSCLALTGIFLFVLFAVGLVERIGIAPGAALMGVVGAAFALFVLAALLSHSRRAIDFYVADRKISGVFGGLAGASSFAGLLAIGIVGRAYATDTECLVAAGAFALGYILLALVAGPRLRSFGAYTAGDFLAARFGGAWPRLGWALISFTVSMLLLVAHLKIAGSLIETLLHTTPEHALYAAAALTVVAALPGGMRSLTWTQAIQYFVIALACLVPVAFLALSAPGAENVMAQDFSALLIARLPPWTTLVAPQSVLPLVLAIVGAASLPQLFAQTLTARSPREAGTSMVWVVLFAAILVLAGMVLSEFLAGSSPATFNGGLADPSALLSSLPAVFAGLIVAGVCAALFALGEAALFSASAALSHDIFDEVLDRRGPEGRRILVARLLLVAVAAGAAALAARWQASAPVLLQWALALAAAGSFAPLVLGLWWRRCNEVGALAGMVGGFGFTALLFLMAQKIVPAAMVTSDWAEISAPGAAMVGLLISSVATIGLSLATPDAEARARNAENRSGAPPIRERPA